MGQADGFLLYERRNNGDVLPAERITGFGEFHTPLSEEARRCQAARCMNCGVPFCQSAMELSGMITGCPLHNLIPEWNDAIYRGQDEHALSRLLKTNPFPEFTGRVCPALCEKACINGCDGEAVTVHDNELYIIETAYKNGTMKARVPERKSGKRVAVIGSGPSGLAAAEVLITRGHAVTVYEREDQIGGLLMYGIPNMKLDKQVIQRRRRLMEEEGVIFKTGHDVGRDTDFDRLRNDFDAVIMCCGAKQARRLDVPGIEDVKGVRFAVDFLSEVTKHLLADSLQVMEKQVKNKHVVVVGGGDTGNDCIGTVIRLGAKSVKAIEMMPKPPVERREDNPWPQWPKILKTDYGHEEAIEKFGTDPRIFETTVDEVISDKGRIKKIKIVKVSFDKGKLKKKKDSIKELPCDLLLIAAGFTGAEGYLPDAAGVATTARGTVSTKDLSFATEKEGVFAAGDMRRGQSLVVWAISEGKRCAEEVDAYLMGYSN
ncbi:MAG: glutamate synthase subunit beta [Eubacterium sp.]|nr:glutamate synthase subunit beta [Eubacterium sp.]